MKFVCVAGARPNFMKVKPVVDSLERCGASVVLVHTEQHYDDPMSAVFLRELGLRTPDVSLGSGSGTHAEQTARVMEAFEPVLLEHEPDATVVVGDVNSTLACALVAAKSPTLLAHVEAGLRSRDRSMPEEVNRIVTDTVSDVLLAPVTLAVLLDAFGKVAARLPLLLPAHPRTQAALRGSQTPDGLRVIDPLGTSTSSRWIPGGCPRRN